MNEPVTTEALADHRYKMILARIYILGLGLIVFSLLLAGLLQRAQSDLRSVVHQQKVDNYTACQARNRNVARTNRFYDSLAAVEADNPFKTTSPSTIARRIAIYKAARLTIINCGVKP